MTSVCILLQNFYDIDIRVRRKAEALVAAGYSVDVYALRGRNGQRRYSLEGVNVYTVSLGKKRGSLVRYAFEYLAFFLWCLFRVTMQMPKKRYAIVDVNTLPDFLIFAGVFARWMGAKLVLDMHEITPEFYMSKYGIGQNSHLIRFLTFVEKISFDFADCVITINQPITELLISRGLAPGKATVITNAADDARFVGYSRSAASEQAKLSAGFVMMYHGTLTKLYGLDIAIEAFALAQGEMPGAEFWILGGGTETESLQDLARQYGVDGKVKLLGMVPPSEIPAWVEKCDVGVLPIRRDVFLEYASPNKLAEYIVMGKPVIISRLRAIQHYFSESALAYFEPNNAAALAKQMVHVFRDGDLRRVMAAEARREYAPISWEIMKQRYLSLMETVLAPKVVNRPQVPGSHERAELVLDSAAARLSRRDILTTANPEAIVPLPAYVLITPARNEAAFIEQTILSVIAQTERPLKWVIVSDGSTDGTDEIVSRYAVQHPWIELVRVPEHAQRNFAGKVHAFNAGYSRVAGLQYEVIGNLDGDVSFDADYLRFLVSKFAENPRLGVAGTPYREQNPVHNESFKSQDHVSGACQMFRRRCFEEIGGYLPVRSGGVDLIALLAAQAKGWETMRYDERFCFHHRNVGSGDHVGICARMLNRGKKDYLLGSHPLFEVFRSVNQMRARPYVAGGVLMLVGYFRALAQGLERSMPPELIRIRQRDQLQRLKQTLRRPWARRDAPRLSQFPEQGVIAKTRASGTGTQ